MTLPAFPHEMLAGASPAANAEAFYRAICAEPSALARAEPFTAHILACALAIGLAEAQTQGHSLGAALGLDRASLDALTAQWAPGARGLFLLGDEPAALALDEEEAQLHALLVRFKSDNSPLCGWITSIVTRRAMAPRHLWQDLGLTERRELTRLMREWFPELAAANIDNMKWKKFLYRQICALEGFSLCAAPSCRECADFDCCFGAEDGESALARLARS